MGQGSNRRSLVDGPENAARQIVALGALDKNKLGAFAVALLNPWQNVVRILIAQEDDALTWFDWKVRGRSRYPIAGRWNDGYVLWLRTNEPGEKCSGLVWFLLEFHFSKAPGLHLLRGANNTRIT
jgi:hypothetical protein